MREAVGIEHAEPALFSLPAPGRLLVVSADDGGVWLVKSNGFMRKLGPYSDAEWSPHGLYVIATERNELVASIRTAACGGSSRGTTRRGRGGKGR